jgi:hypothetical protein
MLSDRLRTASSVLLTYHKFFFLTKRGSGGFWGLRKARYLFPSKKGTSNRINLG